MAIKQVVRFPDPTLRKKTQEISSIGDSIKQLVDHMIDTMYSYRGAGIAAIQIGALERIYIVDPVVAGRKASDAPLVFINPEIEWLSEETEISEEGCLSFPSIFLPIRRSLKARVKALDLQGNPFVETGSGLYARAMQHEQDHLNNKLLYDYASSLKRQIIKRKMEKMTDQEAAMLIAEHGE